VVVSGHSTPAATPVQNSRIFTGAGKVVDRMLENNPAQPTTHETTFDLKTNM